MLLSTEPTKVRHALLVGLSADRSKSDADCLGTLHSNPTALAHQQTSKGVRTISAPGLAGQVRRHSCSSSDFSTEKLIISTRCWCTLSANNNSRIDLHGSYFVLCLNDDSFVMMTLRMRRSETNFIWGDSPACWTKAPCSWQPPFLCVREHGGYPGWHACLECPFDCCSVTRCVLMCT